MQVLAQAARYMRRLVPVGLFLLWKQGVPVYLYQDFVTGGLPLHFPAVDASELWYSPTLPPHLHFPSKCLRRLHVCVEQN